MHEIIDNIGIRDTYRYTFKLRPIITGSLFMLIAIIFRIQHWPGALITIVLSYSGLIAYLFYNIIKIYPSKSFKSLIFKIILMFISYIILSFLIFASMNIHPFGGFFISLISFTIFYLLYFIQDKIRLKKFNNQNQNIQINL